MKLLIASDIHGSAYYCDLLLKAFAAEKADRLLLLGDILYHGPRNDLPRDYAPRQVIGQLSAVKDRVFCVRGNCDAEVDQMVLPFPILADYAVIPAGGRLVYATHGHIYHPSEMTRKTAPSPIGTPARCPFPRTTAPTAICFFPPTILPMWCGKIWKQALF